MFVALMETSRRAECTVERCDLAMYKTLYTRTKDIRSYPLRRWRMRRDLRLRLHGRMSVGLSNCIRAPGMRTFPLNSVVSSCCSCGPDYLIISMLIKREAQCINLALALLSLVGNAIAATTQCNGALYGVRRVQDCLQALDWIPYARFSPPSQHYFRSQQLQLFSEPQYSMPPFAGVRNTYAPNSIVQLPKIWKHSKYKSPQCKSRSTCTLAMEAAPRGLSPCPFA